MPFLVRRSSGYLVGQRVPLKCSQQQKGLFFHPRQMEILTGGQKQILSGGWSISGSPSELWGPHGLITLLWPSAGRLGPVEHGKMGSCPGAGESCKKNSESEKSGFWSQENLGSIPGTTTCLGTLPLRVSVYLLDKWDNNSYLTGVLRR